MPFNMFSGICLNVILNRLNTFVCRYVHRNVCRIYVGVSSIYLSSAISYRLWMLPRVSCTSETAFLDPLLRHSRTHYCTVEYFPFLAINSDRGRPVLSGGS